MKSTLALTALTTGLISSCLAIAIPVAGPEPFCQLRGEPCYKAKREVAATSTDTIIGSSPSSGFMASAVEAVLEAIGSHSRAGSPLLKEEAKEARIIVVDTHAGTA